MSTDLDPVEETLRGMPYLDDDGFTERVMARLPARRERRGVMLGSTAVAAALGAWSLPRLVEEALEASARVSALPPSAIVASGAAVLVLAAVALGRLLWE